MSDLNIAEDLAEALERIAVWANAYPTDIFHVPSSEELARAHAVLKREGMSIDAISAHAMRHALNGVGDIALGALQKHKLIDEKSSWLKMKHLQAER